jgi:hypothetical protein
MCFLQIHWEKQMKNKIFSRKIFGEGTWSEEAAEILGWWR